MRRYGCGPDADEYQTEWADTAAQGECGLPAPQGAAGLDRGAYPLRAFDLRQTGLVAGCFRDEPELIEVPPKHWVACHRVT